MKQKLLSILALLLMAATGAWADITVTWTASDMENTDLFINFEHGEAFNNTIKGITVTASSGGDGAWQANNIDMSSGSTTITFTSSVGNIKSIAITAESIHSYGGTPSGWTLSDGNTKLSWSGDASSTVSMTLSDMSLIYNISEIVFTIESSTVNVIANEGASGEYWATYYNDEKSFIADENTTVFQAALSGNQLTMTEVAGKEIPAGKAVILKSTAASITLTPATTTATLDGNALQGTATAITNPGNAYVLNKGTNGVGFYKLSGSGTIGANKAFLLYDGPSAPSFLNFVEGNVTGIEMPKAATTNSDAEVYDLQGRQVTNPTKGLYIVNGKKVVIK